MKYKIDEIKSLLKNTPVVQLEKAMEQFEGDQRSGVVKLLGQYRKIVHNHYEELERIEKMKEYERKYSRYHSICGIDEAGRGPLAGPVVAGAVILPNDCQILHINDSKQLTHKRREELFDIIKEEAVSIGVGIVQPDVIDQINILQATYEAMRLAVNDLTVEPDILLNDAVIIPHMKTKQVSIVKGDTKSISIAAASIIAKVTRDRIMIAYDEVYPEYGFAANKGYGAGTHTDMIRKKGPSPIHRLSFIKSFV